MTSVSQALPGFASAHAQPRQHASGNSEDSHFGELVHGDEKPAGPQGKHPPEPTSDDPRPARRAVANPAKPQPDQDTEGKDAPKRAAEKSPKGNPDRAKAADDKGGQARSSDAPPFQDRLPLQMALSDIRRFAASPDGGHGKPVAEGGAETRDFAATSASSQLMARHGNRAPDDRPEITESRPRSGHATATTEASGPDFGQKQARVGPAVDTLARKDDILPRMQEAGAGAATPQSWRSAAISKDARTLETASSLDQAKPPASVGKMDVVGQQSFPAPAQNTMSQTASALAGAIASDAGAQPFSSASIASQTANSVAVPTHVLKIELHPAELGAVTASLRLSGEQLSIEMKPQTHEAYRRLTADSDAIVKSLRGLGFDVDKVTILQPSIAVHPAGRADANSAPQVSTGRDQPSFQPGNSGGDNGGGGRQPGRNDGNGAQEFGRTASPARERAGDDMYI